MISTTPLPTVPYPNIAIVFISISSRILMFLCEAGKKRPLQKEVADNVQKNFHFSSPRK
jgi:hypothetical protein